MSVLWDLAVACGMRTNGQFLNLRAYRPNAVLRQKGTSNARCCRGDETYGS